MIIKRIITAAVLIAIVICGLFYLPSYIFKVMASVITLLGAWELAYLFWPNNSTVRVELTYFSTFLAAIVILSFFNLHNHVFLSFSLILGVIWWFIAPIFLVQYVKKGGSIALKSVTKFFIGLFVFVPFLASLLVLQMKFGAMYLLFVITLVCAADIGAFFIGIKWGKTLLAPLISPKKTIEGLCGGVIFALLIAISGGFLLNVHGIKWVSWLILCLITSLWSVIGDLFESMLKRRVGAKDSGNILPGHGGIYDRIDSLTAALPIFALGLMLVNH